ncbi:hypothetical protein [Endozoicomonas arenosclerae]|uniref:hypothetical protein n=1 Tax=Endozoicomonas arenosclerae TaxID=1633495 RepID=UPI0007866039|nr:hypothetical protein [Endozoicomonas arenosclerae]
MFRVCLVVLFLLLISNKASSIEGSLTTDLFHLFKYSVSNPEDSGTVLDSLKLIPGYTVCLEKSARRPFDSNIYKLTDDETGKTVGVKIHREMFPLATHIYQPRKRSVINDTGAVIRVMNTFLVNHYFRAYRVVIYEFRKGITLKQAISDKKISVGFAKRAMERMIKKLVQAKVHVYTEDLSDFLYLEEAGELVLLDWCALADVHSASQSVIDEYVQAKMYGS